MAKLSDFFEKTDKGYAHNILGVYERLFAGMEVKSLLEIGILGGGSIRMFAEVYPKALVVGIDKNDATSVENEYENVMAYKADAYSLDFILHLNRTFGEFDIIIDDGSHILKDQCIMAAHYPHLLTTNGVLVIEDISSIENAHIIQQFIPDFYKNDSYIIDRRGAPCGFPYERFPDRNEIMVVVNRR